MRIINIVTNILESMVQDAHCALQSWQYNRLGVANVKLDNKKPSPTALVLMVQEFQIGYNNFNAKEEVSLNISFLKKETKLDAEGLEEQAIVDEMKYIAIDFIQRLKAVPSIMIENEEIKVQSVFLRSDSNRTGVNIQLDIIEKQGECIGGPVPSVLTITENGEYNVLGISKITVAIPEQTEQSNG